MSENSQISNGGCGIGFPSLLALLFIGLKLTGYINWSWWWVLSPLWIGAILAIVITVAVVVAIAAFSDD